MVAQQKTLDSPYRMPEGWVLPNQFSKFFHYYLEGNIGCLCKRFDSRYGNKPVSKVSPVNKCPECEEMLKEMNGNVRRSDY